MIVSGDSKVASGAGCLGAEGVSEGSNTVTGNMNNGLQCSDKLNKGGTVKNMEVKDAGLYRDIEPKIEFEGEPCGQHGAYTFYRSFRYHSTDNKWCTVRLGQFFHTRVTASCDIQTLLYQRIISHLKHKSANKSTRTLSECNNISAASSKSVSSRRATVCTGDIALPCGTPFKGITTPSKGMTTPSKGITTPSKGMITPSKGIITPTLDITTPNDAVSSDTLKTPSKPLTTPNKPPTSITTPGKQSATLAPQVAGQGRGGAQVSMIGELQLLWEDRNRDGMRLASVKFYFLPEYSSIGREEETGRDEVFTEDDKFIVKLDDLLEWITEDPLPWSCGLVMSREARDLFTSCNVGTSHESNLFSLISANTAVSAKGTKILGTENLQNSQLEPNGKAHVTKAKRNLNKLQEKTNRFNTIILSFPQYCRLAALLKRMEGVVFNNEMAMVFSMLLSTIRDGLMSQLQAGCRIVYCQETSDCLVLQGHDARLAHLAPILKGRKRKKKTISRSAESTDSNESEAVVEKISIKIKPLKNPVGRPAGSKKCLQEREEKRFLKRLYEYMNSIQAPIARVPVLGFQKFNLYKFYQTTMSLGGYDQVTSQRLWKRVYNTMGGSQGITNAATGARQHYEKLLLPFERHLTSMEDNKSRTRLGKQQIQQRPPVVQSLPINKRSASLSVEPSTGTNKTVASHSKNSQCTSPTAAKRLKLDSPDDTGHTSEKITSKPAVSVSAATAAEGPEAKTSTIKEETAVKRDIQAECDIKSSKEKHHDSTDLTSRYLPIAPLKQEYLKSESNGSAFRQHMSGFNVQDSKMNKPDAKFYEQNLMRDSGVLLSSNKALLNRNNRLSLDNTSDTAAVSSSHTSRRLLSGSKMVFSGKEHSNHSRNNSNEQYMSMGKSQGGNYSGKSGEISKYSTHNGAYSDVISLSSSLQNSRRDSHGSKSVYSNSTTSSTSINPNLAAIFDKYSPQGVRDRGDRPSVHQGIMRDIMAGHQRHPGSTPSGPLNQQAPSGDDQPTDLSMKTLKRQEPRVSHTESRASRHVTSTAQDEPLNLSAKPRDTGFTNYRTDTQKSRSDRHSSRGSKSSSGSELNGSSRLDLGSMMGPGSLGLSGLSGFPGYDVFSLTPQNQSMAQLAAQLLPLSAMMPSLYSPSNLQHLFSPTSPLLPTSSSLPPSLAASLPPSLAASLPPSLAAALPPSLAASLPSSAAGSLPSAAFSLPLDKASSSISHQNSLLSHPAFAAAALAAGENPAAAAMLAAGLRQYDILQAAAAAAASGGLGSNTGYRS